MKSIGYDSGSIGRASVGVMEKGEYTFTTDRPEEMTVVTGALRVLIPGAPDWQVFTPGETFLCRSAANSTCKSRSPAPTCASI